MYQECLILLYDVFLAYDEKSSYNFFVYFNSSLNHKLCDFYRKEKKEKRNLSLLREKYLAEESRYEYSIDYPDTMSPKEKKIIELRYVDNLSVKDIANIYSLSYGTIYKIIKESKQKIREEIEKTNNSLT